MFSKWQFSHDRWNFGIVWERGDLKFNEKGIVLGHGSDNRLGSFWSWMYSEIEIPLSYLKFDIFPILLYFLVEKLIHVHVSEQL